MHLARSWYQGQRFVASGAFPRRFLEYSLTRFSKKFFSPGGLMFPSIRTGCLFWSVNSVHGHRVIGWWRIWCSHTSCANSFQWVPRGGIDDEFHLNVNRAADDVNDMHFKETSGRFGVHEAEAKSHWSSFVMANKFVAEAEARHKSLIF